jgi:peptide/nickel transport system ATP-binding protein
MGSENLVDVAGLRVVARGADGREICIVKDVSFSIARGEVVALIGESGSGKTTIALSLLGHTRAGCRIVAGQVSVGGTNITALSHSALSRVRGRDVAYVAQSAAAAFNPAQRLMTQVIEAAGIHRLASTADAEAKARALFRSLALPDPDHIGARFVHQLSGGQLQRVMAAMALITDPSLVILDEPTTALDVTTQIEVLRAFKSVVRERRTTALYVSHDLAVVAQIADRIIVLRNGEIVEVATTATLLSAPSHSYTQTLLRAADPGARAVGRRGSAPPDNALSVRHLVAGYGAVSPAGRPEFPVLHDISLQIPAGGALGVIGESGSGKSTLARVIAGLLPAASGDIELDGVALAPRAERRSRQQLQSIQIVFQMADTALNPAHSVGRILARPLAFYHSLRGAAARRRVASLLDMVHLPAGIADRQPGELSGGQKQRVNLARALAAEPRLILCDEVTSALDTVVAAAILDLLGELRRELGIAYLFISHDLSTVRAVCDEVMILYAGRQVEMGKAGALMDRPMHPYTELLTQSVPELRVGWLDGVVKAAAVSTQRGPASDCGCVFFDRCVLRSPTVCDIRPPPSRCLGKGSEILCHRSEAELAAAQIGPPARAPELQA